MQLSEYDDNFLIEELANRGIYVISLEEINKIKEEIIREQKNKIINEKETEILEKGILLLFDHLQEKIKE